jgi:hypothetical protein
LTDRTEALIANLLRAAMTIEDGAAIVLAYVLVSMGVIIAFLLAAFVIGWFIGRLRQRRRGHRAEKSNLTGGGRWPAARITLRQGRWCMTFFLS